MGRAPFGRDARPSAARPVQSLGAGLEMLATGPFIFSGPLGPAARVSRKYKNFPLRSIPMPDAAIFTRLQIALGLRPCCSLALRAPVKDTK